MSINYKCHLLEILANVSKQRKASGGILEELGCNVSTGIPRDQLLTVNVHLPNNLAFKMDSGLLRFIVNAITQL